MVEPNRISSKISLVVADVDGTLVTADKVLTQRTVAAVKALHAAGVAFAITSGRPPRGIAMLIHPLALRTPIAGFNGGIFVKPDMTIMEEHLLPAEVARRAVEVIFHNGMDVWFTAARTGLSVIFTHSMSRENKGPSSSRPPSCETSDRRLKARSRSSA